MRESVSVDQALRKGHFSVNIPVIAIILGTFGLFVLMTAYGILAPPLVGLGILAGFICGWLYWSFAITRWRLWAFSSVRNVHELKRRAIRARLIWPDGNLLGKTEIWSGEAKAKWKALQSRFDQPDEVVDDPGIPRQTEIYYSKVRTAIQWVFAAMFGSAAIFTLAINGGKPLLPLFFILCLAGYFAYLGSRPLFQSDPLLTVSQDGIRIKEETTYPWASIQNEQVIREGGRYPKYSLVFNHSTGKIKHEITELATSPDKLEHLMAVYRKRAQQYERFQQAR